MKCICFIKFVDLTLAVWNPAACGDDGF